MTTQLDMFYGGLATEVRYSLQQRAIRINARESRIVQDIIDNGRDFTEARDELRHNKAGGFRGWIEHHGWSHMTAYRYMRVYEEFGNCTTVLQLTPQVLYLLTESATPDEAREEILDMADAGETVTPSQAQAVINQIREYANNGSVREMTAAAIIEEIKRRPQEPIQVINEAVGILDHLYPTPPVKATGITIDEREWEDDALDPPPDPIEIPLSTPMAVHFSSATPEWYTPRHVIERVLSLFGEIDLDPCSNAKGAAANVPAGDHFTQADDGLSRQWHGRVYMNPPYGDEIGQWTARLLQAYADEEIDEAIALLPARTDTAWFRPLMAHRCCFVHGRLKFSGYENSAPFPSVIVYLGPDRENFIEYFGDLGTIMERAS